MVVKTDVCSFTEMRVYPGHGIRFVTRNGLLVVLGSSKVSSLHHQRKKPARLSWTLASRRAHKKLNTDASTKKRARRVVKVQRGYVGAEKIEEVRKKNATTRPTAPISAQKNVSGGLVQAAVAEAKLKQKAAQAARKAAGVSAGAGKGKGAPAAAKHAGKGR